jgi:hypothetical protein
MNDEHNPDVVTGQQLMLAASHPPQQLMLADSAAFTCFTPPPL